jgi:hypothetical protein
LKIWAKPVGGAKKQFPPTQSITNSRKDGNNSYRQQPTQRHSNYDWQVSFSCRHAMSLPSTGFDDISFTTWEQSRYEVRTFRKHNDIELWAVDRSWLIIKGWWSEQCL